MNKALDLLREIRPSIPKEVLELWCKDRDAFLASHPAVEQADVAAKLTFINGRPAMCGCQVEYSDGGGEYSDVIYVTLCAKHSGSAILDLVATNRIALTPEYEGQWHADLYLDREIPLAKVEGATPAEAVLALMSAERIDPEQESVEQAEAERPEVVARVVHSNPVVLGQCGPLNANDELMTVAQHAASVARWAEMFNRVEQERDVALARVAELEKQEPVATVAKVPGEDWNSLDFHRDLQDMQPGTKLYAAPVAQAQQLHDLDKQCRDDVARALGLRPNQERGFAWSYLLASIKSCVKASEDSAQAQHSVPIAPELKRALGLVVAALEADGDRPTSKYALSELKKVLAAAPVCRLSRSALTDAQMRRLYDSSTETENERLGFEAFARLIRRAEAVHQIAAAPGKEVGHE
ncbi:hypothetical protein [Pseudomonas aeruginosa]|uniref:hypothetical protein n=1 Tax=Pseudomonas aeruginosa TaxID=287 RepID=UPI0019122D5B|nr:hypothetical protein [Pseudomonas aeruginosa]